MTYRLTRRAEEDIIDIYRRGMEDFGETQADSYHAMLEKSFERLALFPQMARERRELRPPVRVHPVGAHVILYLIENDRDILIVRIRHQREDWINSSAAS